VHSPHIYEARPRKHKRSTDLISDVLPFSRLFYGGPNAVSNAIGYAQHYSRSHDVVIHAYDAASSVIETHEHRDDFKKFFLVFRMRTQLFLHRFIERGL